MDPDICWEQVNDPTLTPTDRREAAEDMHKWARNGGFLPVNVTYGDVIGAMIELGGRP